MRTIIIAAGAAAVLALGAAPAHAADDKAMMAPIDGFIRASNANVLTHLERFFTASPSLVDEFAPYHWSGPGAVKAWASGVTAASAQQGLTAPQLDYGPPRLVQRQGRHAYVVAPCTVSFKMKGKPQSESGILTFVVDRTGKGWRIAAMAWSGSPPPQ